jgi:SNF2 family DNA or RNA helicase
MTKIENISVKYPDKYGIKDVLREGHSRLPEFLELSLRSYRMYSSLLDENLTIEETLRKNENISIFEHQIRAAQRVKNVLGGTAMLSDEVGLGKTIEAGIIIKEFIVTGLAKKVLILAPPSLLPQWQDEMKVKFNLDFVSQKLDSRFSDVKEHDLLLMSHSSAIYPNYSKSLEEVFWDLVIVDEAHSMKNSETLKHKLVRDLSKRNLLLLSATPVQNNLSELYNLVELLQPGLLGTWKQFRDKYTLDKQSRILNSAFRSELQNILSKVIIRTTRNEVKYIKFKKRIPHTEILESSDDERTLYSRITNVIRDAYNADKGSNFLQLMIYQRLAASSTPCAKRAIEGMRQKNIIDEEEHYELMQIAERIDIDVKLEFLLDIVSKDKSKFLIFTEFIPTQNYIVEKLEQLGETVAIFNGELSAQTRFEQVSKFKNEARIMVSTGAGGEGQNFQFCHNVVNYDLPWNPMRIEQKIGRVHRIGQTEDVNIYNYAVDGTIEAYILQLLFQKINLFVMTLGEMDLIFESDDEEMSHKTWFKEFLLSKSPEDTSNRFSVLGEKIKKQKELADVVSNFSDEVFENFNLSSVGDSK